MNENSPHPLNIRLLGDFCLEYDGAPVTGISTPRLQSLLAYLLLHRDAPQSRAHLAFQFWPDSTDAQARSNLRTLLHRLRRALPDALPDDAPYLVVDAQTVQWHPEAPASVDVIDFEDALAQAEDADASTARQGFEQAASLYGGDLLPSCYDDWILPHRERLRQAHLRALERLTRLLEDRREYDAAITHARSILRLDPLHEAATRRLMHLHTLKGDRTGALRAYHTCATALQRELGVEPSPATQRAYEQLLSAGDQPQPAPSPATGLTPLVGREAEWAQLLTAWRRAARGPRFVLLLGEAGIGKTRLVEELLHWAGRQNINHAYARCYAAEGDLAYAPVTALLRALPLPPLDDLWLSEVARLLPEVLAEYPDLTPPPPMIEAWRRPRLFEALALAAIGPSRPQILVVDDLQWCDRDSLEWFHFLLRFDPKAPLLLVGTCRPEELDEDCPLATALPALHRDVRIAEIELGPLDQAGTANLAAGVSGQTLDPTAAAHLYTETEGNPLFVVESLRAGLPASETLPGMEGLPLPPRVQAVLATRLAQLSEPAQEIAGLAATIGRQFSVPLLLQAGDTAEHSLARGLDELWQRRIVRERGADAYDFGHDKLREAAYGALKPATRRLLHRRVAQALESVHASDPDAVSRQIAAHYRRGGLPAQAIPYYLRAGEAAKDICAQDEAIACFERGLDLLEAEEQVPYQAGWHQEKAGRNQMVASSQMAASFHEGLGDVLWQLSRYDEARDTFKRVFDLLDRHDRIAQSRLQRKVFGTWWPQGEYQKALGALGQADTILGPQPEKPSTGWTEAQVAWWLEWSWVQGDRLRIQYSTAQLDELDKTLARMAHALSQCTLPPLRAAYSTFSLMSALRRDRYLVSGETAAKISAALATAEQWGSHEWVAAVEWLLGMALLHQGDLDGAGEHLQAGLALAERTGNLINQTYNLTWLSTLHRKLGEAKASREYALRGIETATATQVMENAAFAMGNLAWLAWREGDLAEAEKQGRAALEIWEQTAFVYAFHWTARFPLLAVAVEKDVPAGALDHARALLHPQQQRLPEPLETALEAAIQAADDNGTEAAGQHLERVVEVAKETGFL